MEAKQITQAERELIDLVTKTPWTEQSRNVEIGAGTVEVICKTARNNSKFGITNCARITFKLNGVRVSREALFSKFVR